MKTYLASYKFCSRLGVWSKPDFVTVEAENEWEADAKVQKWVKTTFNAHDLKIDVNVAPRIE